MAARRFATTRWTVVLSAGDRSTPEARAALAELCEIYWPPVYEFVRHSGRSPDDARDVTQGFFTRVVEKGDFKNARPELGRFRTFLLTAVRHFLANQYDHDHALKRGGGDLHVPIGAASSDQPGAESIDPPAIDTPESVYERRWAMTTLKAALSRLEAECERAGRRRMFDVLSPFLTGDASASHAAAGATLGLAENSLRVALHRLRKQYGQCLRDQLAGTLRDPADVDGELAYLLAVVSR